MTGADVVGWPEPRPVRVEPLPSPASDTGAHYVPSERSRPSSHAGLCRPRVRRTLFSSTPRCLPPKRRRRRLWCAALGAVGSDVGVRLFRPIARVQVFSWPLLSERQLLACKGPLVFI
ncbi:hypothetical protein MTO96_008522 [Rhipicephalus appendiculatus]